MIFTFRGLVIEATLSDYDPGDWLNPPEGGECEEFTILGVQDMSELVDWMASSGLESSLTILQNYFTLIGELPKCVVHWIENRWDDPIRTYATEHSYD